MKKKNLTLAEFYGLEFNFDRQQIKASYLDYKGIDRTIYCDMQAFEDWVEDNNLLEIDSELLNPLSGEFSQSVHKVKMEDLLADEAFQDIRDHLTAEYFKELLHLEHISLNLQIKPIIERFKKELLLVAKALEVNYKN